jgi:glycosyltransferase involved in cell wall biosynthesis
MFEISVIIAVYSKTKIDEYNEALLSIVNQTYLPKEIIIVYDGPGCNFLLTTTQSFISNYKNIYFNQIFLEKNIGPGLARNRGVSMARYELIAIMDSDDYSYKNRFELQIEEFKKNNIDLVGGQIDEYNELLDTFLQTRQVPEKFSDIRKNLKFYSTINNVTILIKKEVFIKIGGYDGITFGEDYVMWAKLISNDFKAVNLPVSLVKVRTGFSFMIRRYSIKNFKNNIKLSIRLSKYKSIGFTFSILRLLKFSLFMFLPDWVKKLIFIKYIRKHA